MMFKYPHLLWLFLVYIPLIAWYIWKQRNSNATLGISSSKMFDSLPVSWRVVMMHVNFALRLAAIGLLIIALARPQTYDSQSTSQIEGTDIVLAMDISGSMDANDFKPNRMEAAKEVASKFISGRTSDNIGLVVFAGESLTLMPLTNDRAAVMNSLGEVHLGLLQDGTAVGDGISSAINRLLSGKAKSKSIILLTDGSNNAGQVAPATAAQIAKQNGIRIYTIGVGTDQPITITDPYGFASTTMEAKIDEPSLKQIASLTGGKYFRAKDKNVLQQVFTEIDELEKTKLDVSNYTRTEENFTPWLMLSLLVFVVELIIRYTVLRRIP